GGGVQCDDRIILRQHKHHSIDDDGIEEILSPISHRVGPRNLEFLHVGASDLLESGVLRGVSCSAVLAPRGVVLRERAKSAGHGNRQPAEIHEAYFPFSPATIISVPGCCRINARPRSDPRTLTAVDSPS